MSSSCSDKGAGKAGPVPAAAGHPGRAPHRPLPGRRGRRPRAGPTGRPGPLHLGGRRLAPRAAPTSASALIIEELAPRTRPARSWCGATRPCTTAPSRSWRTIRDRGTVEFGYEVIPGISSVSALAARHRTALNQVGRPIAHHHRAAARRGVPGRRRRHGGDARRPRGFTASTGEGCRSTGAPTSARRTRSWSPDRSPRSPSGSSRVRAEARERHGWIMDTYLLRHRPEGAQGPEGAGPAAGTRGTDSSDGTDSSGGADS